MSKPSIKEVIVVEGRYDKNTLSQVVDATILDVGGFAVFNDKRMLSLLRTAAEERGVILFTDPDGAGFVIRNRLKGALPEGSVKNAFAPDVFGKEKRKRKGGKEGKLGVEGMRPEVLLEALRRAGATFEGEAAVSPGERISKSDMLDAGLVGNGSSARRRCLVKELNLPEHISSNSLLEVLNLLWTRREFWRRCACGLTVSGKVDRPLGSRHSEHPETIYPVNYGWVEGIIASDGEAQDVYILGADEAISEFSGKIIAVYERLDDAEDKWIVSLDGREYSDEEILGAICFQEQFFKGRLTRGYMSLQNE